MLCQRELPVDSEKNKFLFITLSNVGDALLTTPVLQFLHRYDETASIDIVCDKRSSVLFRHCPYRGEIYHKQKERLLRGVPALLFELRRKRYVLIVDLRTDILARLIRAEKRLIKTGGDMHVHAVEKHFSAVSEIAGNENIPPTALWLGQTDKDYANDICCRLPGRKWLCIGPGANWDKKIWPEEKYATLVRALAGEFDALVLLGNKADNTQAQTVIGQAPFPCVNLLRSDNAAGSRRCHAENDLIHRQRLRVGPHGQRGQHPVLHPVRPRLPATLPPLGLPGRLAQRPGP